MRGEDTSSAGERFLPVDVLHGASASTASDGGCVPRINWTMLRR